MLPAQNVSDIGANKGRVVGKAPIAASIPGANSAMGLFGAPAWTYVTTMAGPVRGPQPRLARGSGRTGNSALPGNAPQLPGYLSQPDYKPTLNTYDPVNRESFLLRPPREIPVGTDGRSMVGTYAPHDVTPGQRFLNHMRQAAAWQVQEYPPDNRYLIKWQQVMRYRPSSFTQSARPLDSSQYFLGYQVNPNISAQIGQNTLGYMGSQ